MLTISLQEAEGRLAELIAEAAKGEAVIIQHSDGAYFQLVPLDGTSVRPKFGSAHGFVKMSEDFDDPLPDFETYGP